MTGTELKDLPVKKRTKEDADCFMWVTDSHIDEALERDKSWGFTYKTIAFNWSNTSIKRKLL
jgi:N6-adenosine-specific RNA methylase IME4